MSSLLLLLSLSCAPLVRAPRMGGGSFQLSRVAQEGDPARRASTRLSLKALDKDVVGDPGGAVLLYERALQVDPTNPYAYLAYARHLVDGPDGSRALPFLDKADALLGPTAREELAAHLIGLRGVALDALGRRAEASRLLAEARQRDPYSWADGYLAPGELR